MSHRICAIIFIFLCNCFSANLYAQTIQKLNILAGIESGAISVTHSAIDIGAIHNIFSGDNELARSANINPFQVTLEFQNEISLAASRILMIAGSGEWYLTCASSLEDLTNESGSYFIPFPKRNLQDAVPDSVHFTSQTCKFIRLIAKRTSGDDYVHLQSWNLYAEQLISDIEIRTPQNQDQTMREKDFPLSVFGIDATSGLKVELPNTEIIWNTSDTSIASITNGVLRGHIAGTVTITAQFNGISGSKQVEIIEDNNGPDLCISYIKRLPEIDYVPYSTNPTVEGWPADGQEISWKAYVRNYSPNIQKNIAYRWLLNGEVIETGAIAEIKPYELAYATLQSHWSFDRNELSFEIDTDHAVDEVLETNNALTIYTDALTVGFYVEQYVYDYFHRYQSELHTGTNSWDDWAQFQVKYWNTMMANAIFPMSPNGVLDRIRLDSIAVVPNGSLPLHGGLASNNPNSEDKSVDLQWGFPASLIVGGDNFYSNHTTAEKSNPFYYEPSLFHELGHARYLHDVYLYDVHYGNSDGEMYIRIKEEGQYIGNTKYMPVLAYEMVHDSYYKGLMSNDYTKFDEYCAVLYNLKAGQRALCGNMNSPCDINARINDLPAQNYLKLNDQYGNELINAKVSVYQVSYDASIDKWVFEDAPAFSVSANNDAVVNIGRCPFTQDGHIDTYYNGCNELYCIIKVEHQNRVGYQFVESSQFNMEYWRGNTDSAIYNVKVPIVSNEIEQVIDLSAGWNLISFSLFVNENAIDSLFANILPSVEIIKTDDAFYSATVPAFLNTLKNIEIGKAYLVKMKAPETLMYSGSIIDTSQTHYFLDDGWQLVGSIYKDDKSIESVIKENQLNVSTIKNFNGFWNYTGSENSLFNFSPNEGYFVKVEE